MVTGGAEKRDTRGHLGNSKKLHFSIVTDIHCGTVRDALYSI
jgi:hypothetical protein